MKKWMALLLTLIAALSLCSCKDNAPQEPTQDPTTASGDPTVPDVTEPTAPDATEPQGIPDLVYDLSNDQGLSDIFEEKTVEEWNAMGRYTLHLGGLHTPVVLNMDGTSVLSISAFDQTVDLGTDGMADDYHDGYSPVQSIRSTYDAVVIHVSFGEMGDGSILITKNQIFKYPKEFDSSIFLWVKDDGTLGYRQTWIFPEGLEQSWVNALEQLTGRDQVLYQTGRAEIVGDELDLLMEDTVVVSDLFDLDAIFAECKAAGKFTEYETVDQLFAANNIEIVYDMANHQWISQIPEQETVEEWNALGQYTLRLEGLHTPVVLDMDGTSVLSISAFDQTVELGGAGMANDYHDGYSPVDYIRSTEDAVVIRICGGESPDDFILITKDKVFRNPKERGGHIALWVEDDGTLGYRQTWMFPESLEQSWVNALEHITGRDQVLYQTGRAEIVGNELDLTVEDTVVVSDLYDLDAMFAEGKAAGKFTEYETVDELFEANKAVM